MNEPWPTAYDESLSLSYQDLKRVLFAVRPTVPEASEEGLMPAQPPEPPLAKDADLDIVGLD